MSNDHTRNRNTSRFLICINNDGYQGSLEVRKLYEFIDDPQAAEHGQVRVIDESGEDYLFSADRFIVIEMSREQSSAVLKAS